MWIIVLIAAVIVGMSFFAANYVWRFQNPAVRNLVMFGLAFVSWIFVELAVTRYLRRKKTLECAPKA